MGFITVQNLKFKYPQSDEFAVDDVSFTIEKGAYVAIVGHNGSGKSTISRLLCGLDVPQSGQIDIAKGNTIGIVFQSPKEQLVSAIVSRDTSFGPQNLGLSKSEVELRTIESLNIVDMLDRASSSTNALSLGQTQKIALSGVIALRPEILILDEAVSMLDPVSRNEILEFVKYWHKCGNTIIQITHEMQIVNDADTVIGMNHGKMFFYGTKKAFLENPENVQLIQGNPLEVCDKKERFFQLFEKQKALSVQDLSFTYEKIENQSNHGVYNINFELKKGSITALTGPSGSGKSTVLELCAGLLESHSNGKIFAESKPVLAQQNAKAALFENFAADDVAFGAINKGISGNELKQIVKESMDLAALPFEKFSERKTFYLSGGEQRRLSIAGILALNADILLFDEPTAGLDSSARFEVLMMMKKLAKNGKTILFSTHKMDEADFSDREIKMERGRIVYDSNAAFQNQPDQPEKKSTENELLCEQKVCSSVKLLSNLRAVSAAISGSNRKKSFIEKIPSFLRIIIFLVMFVLTLSSRSIPVCTLMFVLSVIYARISNLKIKKLISSYLKILPFLLFFTIIQLILKAPLEGEKAYISLKWFYVTKSKLLFCLASILRTYSALGCISAFFVSTPEYDLIDGLNILLFPLKIIRIPVKYFIIIVEIVFRFIPVLIDEASSIIKTQVIRGALGKTKGVFAKIKAIIPLIVPLIVQTIKKSESLADAITMRCFK